MPVIRHLRSTGGRYAVAASLLALTILAALGALACLLVRHSPESSVLAPAMQGHGLEYRIAAVVLASTACTGIVTWWAIGRVLRPLQAVRMHMDRVTLGDLGRRMPVPRGAGEIAELARTANRALARLDEAVAQQRRFAATTSHELRNPIAGLRAELEDALDHPEDTDARHALRTALTTTDRLEAIITDLLAQARLHAGDTTADELIDLTELLAQEAAHANLTPIHAQGVGCAPAVGEGISRADGSDGADGNGFPGVPVRLQAQEGVWVCGSRIQLIRALDNLVGNARRHAVTAVDITLTTADGQVAIAVTDDGPGIPSADRQRVFERFTRLDDGRRLDTGGSGLGLAITRDIAHGHHGTLALEDSAKGARFVLRIPQLDPSVVPGHEPVRPIARHREAARARQPEHQPEEKKVSALR